MGFLAGENPGALTTPGKPGAVDLEDGSIQENFDKRDNL
jgi:hypothetical protein